MSPMGCAAKGSHPAERARINFFDPDNLSICNCMLKLCHARKKQVSHMPYRFHAIASRTIRFGLIGIFAVGLLVGAIRLALPFADLFRPELEAMLTETLGTEVRIGRLELRLAGLVPRLELRDTVLLNPENSRPRLGLAQLWIDLNPTASLRALAPRIESVTLVGARLTIRRLPTGDLAVTGLEGLAGGNDPETMGFFLGKGRFQLVDSDLSWIDEKAGAPPLRLSGVRVHFENRGERHRIGIFARHLDDRRSRLRLVGDLHGAPDRPADWSGEIYLQWQGDDLGRVLAGRLPTGLHLGSDAVAFESWSRLEAGFLSRSLNRIETRGLRVWTESGETNSPPLHLDHVGGLLRWRRVDTGWQLAVKDLVLTRDGTRHPVSDLGVRFAAGDDGGWTLVGGNRVLDLAQVRDLLTWVPQLPPEALDQFDAIHPRGKLHDLRFCFVHRPELPPRWAVSARIEDLSLDAQGQFPAIRGFNAELAANERAGRLVLSGSDLNIDLPRLSPHPLRFDTAAGKLHWRRDSDGALRIGTRQLVVGNADIATRSRFSIVLPVDGGSPFLDLQTEFRAPEVAKVRDYLPSRKLRKKLVRWLEHALVGGSIPHGALLFRGIIAEFPFDDHQGRFQALSSIRDATLNFNPDWPPLKKLVGEARFENRGMELFFSKGRYLDSDLRDVSARIPDLDQAFVAEVQGRAEGPFADHLRVFGETPLRKKFGALAEVLATKGNAHLDLDMAIPLNFRKHEDLLRLAGELSWPGPATLAIPDRDIVLTDLTGKLRFTERDLYARSIGARLWGVPIRLRVDTRRSGKGAGATTRIRTTGHFSTAVLARQFPFQAWESLEGQPRLVLDLTLTGANFGESVPPLDFELTSDLVGLALELPAPLGKPAAETRRLRLAGRLAPKEALHIRGSYGDLGIVLELDQGGDGKHRLARGSFSLGGSVPPLPKREGFHLGGSLAALDLRPWLDRWAHRKRPHGDDPGGGTALHSVQVDIGRLQVADTILNDVRFELADQDHRWEAKLRARELAGKITVPHRARREPLRIRLARLDLKGVLDQGPKDNEIPASKHSTDPRQAHTPDLNIEQLVWGKHPLGRMTLRSQAVPDGLEFTQISLIGPAMAVEGRGSWLWTDAGPRSNFSLTAQGQDPGRFLGSLGLGGLFHGAPGTIDLDLDWPGTPLQLAAADLKGRIRIDLGAGSLPEVDPGVGRVLGILNLGALQRRLGLDFDDLFDRGYAFEKISGQIDIENGSATIEELLIRGPAADLSIIGSINLVKRELNQIVTVTPHIGTGVAIAGVVAGGPLVGAAVLLADLVSGGAIDKLSRYQYHLSGPWADPEIRRGGLSVGIPKETKTGTAKDTLLPSPSDADKNPFLEGY